MPSRADNAEAYYDRHSEGYVQKWARNDEGPANPQHFYRKNVTRTLIELADIEQGERVVEIGAGTGLVLRELLKITAPVVGTDISIEMLRRAQEELSPEWRVEIVDALPDDLGAEQIDVYLLRNDVKELGLPAGRFDAIVSMEVFRYIEDIDRAFRKVRSVMRDDAVFVFTVTNLWSMSLFPIKYSLRKLLGRVDLRNELAQYFVTEKGIRRTLERTGFEPVELRKLSWLTFNPLVRRIVKTRKGAERAVAVDRRLESVPLANRLFDTLVVAAKPR